MSLRPLLPFLVAVLLPFPLFAQSPEDWQQEVAYDMDITLHADEHQYSGAQTLDYTNNSPDTLHTVYYHLYFNAFHPESMFAERHRHLSNPDGRTVPRIFNLAPDEQGWHRIHSLTQDGQSVDYDITETVMRVDLAEPIPPGETSTFEMDWRAQVPLQTRRSGRDSRGDGIDYTMTQWYPKMAEYDERGWHADFYVNREYYAPYGSFDVKITLPAEYTIGATGLLQNPEEIGHGYDLDGNGTWRPSDGRPDTDSLTWHFTADDVHNFAWSADPDYIHDKVSRDGTTHHVLYKPEVEDIWAPLKDDMPEITSFFNEEYGEYAYPQMTVAQGGDGGMEYPMFTVVTSYNRPLFEEKSSYRSVLGTTVHEFAHMWYYAALGSNEADYAWIDEGFTSYATSEGMAHLTDGNAQHPPTGIVRLQKLGLYEGLSTPADWFETNSAYGASYFGGETVVDLLGYVIGDEPRDRWLKRLFRSRKFQHPDPFDLELFAEQESDLMLDWYFWQFTRSTREVDDKIGNLEHSPSDDGYEASFTLEREGTAVLPHDVKLTLEDGSTQWVNVPLATMHGHKPVPDDWIVTEPWPWVQPKKTFTVEVPSPVAEAELDPNERTPDLNRLNNSTDFPLTTRFLHAPETDWSSYELGVRPLAGYAHDFGVGGGLQLRGQYFMGDYPLRATLSLWPEVLFSNGDDPALVDEPGPLPGPRPLLDTNTGSWFDGLDYELRYEHPFSAFGPRSTIEASSLKHLGVMENRVSVRASLRSPIDDANEWIQVSLLHQLNSSDRVFGLYRSETEQRDPQGSPVGSIPSLVNPWGQSQTASARLQYSVSDDVNRIAAFAELGGAVREFGHDDPLSAFSPLDQATRISVSARRSADLEGLRGNANLQIGIGANDLLPHKQFRLGGQSIESTWRNDTYRQTSAAFQQPANDAHLVGFGTAGPVAYLRANGLRTSGLTGENVVAGRLSLEGSPFPAVNPLSPLALSVFSGVGTVWDGGAFLAGFNADDLVADAGLGARYSVSDIPHIDRWTAQSDFLQDLDVVAKFPVWASDPDLLDPDQDEFAFRWLIGVEI